MDITHLGMLLWQTAEKFPEKIGLKAKRNEAWRSLCWKEVMHLTLRTAHFLKQLGVREGDRVALWSENRPEWIFCDMGSLFLNAVTVPVYVTLAPSEVRFLLENSRSKVLLISHGELYWKIHPYLNELRDLESIVLMEPTDPFKNPPPPKPLYNLLQEIQQTPSPDPHGIEENLRKDHRSTVATIIYTSGTTGPPKGVLLTHGNFLANLAGVIRAIELKTQDTHLSFLPLSHVFERLCGYYLCLLKGAEIAYAESFDRVAENLREIRPTILLAVPRFYEKVQEKIVAAAASSSIKKRVFDPFFRIGLRVSRLKERQERIPFFLALGYALARILVVRKVHQEFGGKLRFAVSGGAPLSEKVARFFHALDLLILEGYGLTETSPVISCNRLDDFKFGSVGKPLENVRVRIAADGEILTQSDCVMKGYLGLPEATSEVLREGWFHTGDLGRFDADGFLRITGRKKEIIVTSSGKKISPDHVEALYQEEPLIQRCIIYGEGKNFLTALIVPNGEALKNMALEKGIRIESTEKIRHEPWAREAIESSIRRVNEKLAPFEQIKYFHILEQDFTISDGELTPTLKPRRSVILSKHARILESFYKT